jgi:hypothetical protein
MRKETMTRPTKGELDRYREGLTNGRWRFISTGIGRHLLAEIDALRAEMEERERRAFEAGRIAKAGANDVRLGDEKDEHVWEYPGFDDYKAALVKEVRA